jgi:trk/ktr system potassium uptake protein
MTSGMRAASFPRILQRKSSKRESPHPARLVLRIFGVAITLGTILLWLPISSNEQTDVAVLDAFFTATSAVTVTGLVVVDTATAWNGFGKLIILLLIQLGGLGIMTMASMIGLVLSRKVGLRRSIIARAEIGAFDLGDVKGVIRAILFVTGIVEATVATILTMRFWFTYDQGLFEGLWNGIFHAVSAFNNAGFSTYSNSLEDYVSDPIINFTVMTAVVLGGLGFPVIAVLWGSWRPRRTIGLHAKIVLAATAVFLAMGWLGFTILEWNASMGDLAIWEKFQAGLFQSVTVRTAGFNTVDVGAMKQITWFFAGMLMFVGAGSASTAGGVKVTTMSVVFATVWSEIRGDNEVNMFKRHIPRESQRQALVICALGLTGVVFGTLGLMAISSELGLSALLFESISAFGTVGLTSGATAAMGRLGHLLLIVLMLVGRLGPLTVGAALVLRGKERSFHYPEERPIIG